MRLACDPTINQYAGLHIAGERDVVAVWAD
jgi:hypothetical protein